MIAHLTNRPGTHQDHGLLSDCESPWTPSSAIAPIAVQITTARTVCKMLRPRRDVAVAASRAVSGWTAPGSSGGNGGGSDGIEESGKDGSPVFGEMIFFSLNKQFTQKNGSSPTSNPHLIHRFMSNCALVFSIIGHDLVNFASFGRLNLVGSYGAPRGQGLQTFLHIGQLLTRLPIVKTAFYKVDFELP